MQNTVDGDVRPEPKATVGEIEAAPEKGGQEAVDIQPDGTVAIDGEPAEQILELHEDGTVTPPPFTWNMLYDKVVVRRARPKETYDEGGRIAVAETEQKAQNQGIVIAVGDGRLVPQYGTAIPLKVFAGMEVLFGKHSGIDLEEDPELVILREDELLGYRWPKGVSLED